MLIDPVHHDDWLQIRRVSKQASSFFANVQRAAVLDSKQDAARPVVNRGKETFGLRDK